MADLTLAGTALAAGGAVAGLCPPLAYALRRAGALDVPSARSSHAVPTPRGGGLAPAAIFPVAGALALPDGRASVGLLVVAVALATVGLVEDLRGVEPLPRLALQVVGAGVAVPWLLPYPQDGASVAFASGALLAVLWLVAYANVFNFVDGINGISGVLAAVAGATWFLVGSAADVPSLAAGGLLVAAVAAGFLPANLPRARVFLGDVGSYFFGAVLAALVLIGLRAGVPVEALAGPLVIPLADATTTLVRRVVRREPWYRPHRSHVYQRLVALGWSHTRTTLTAGALATGCAAAGSVALWGGPAARVSADATIVLLALAYLALPRLVGGVPAKEASCAS